MPAAARTHPATLVILAGVCAALHVGKLAPAITTLQAALGLSLVQAGFLLSMVQLAGMSTGLVFGMLADGIGPRRSMVLGLAVLGLVSALGAAAQGTLALLLLRACEGFGFLLVVLPAPGLLRELVPPDRLNKVLGLWGTYFPLATALALLLGPLCIQALGWRAWWGALAALALAMAAWLARALPAPPAKPVGAAHSAARARCRVQLQRTLAAPGPWLVSLCFAVYAGQWLAVVGFLPTIYTQAGVSSAATGVLTALAAAVNMLGNVAAGRLLHRGVAPTTLLSVGYATMAFTATAAFAEVGGVGLSAPLRFAAVLAFSAVGGIIPGTLFSLAVRLAPGETTVATTVGLMQQCSAAGQFFGPPLVAWMASQAGGWQWTWLATGACCAAGLALAAALRVLLQPPPQPR